MAPYITTQRPLTRVLNIQRMILVVNIPTITPDHRSGMVCPDGGTTPQDLSAEYLDTCDNRQTFLLGDKVLFFCDF